MSGDNYLLCQNCQLRHGFVLSCCCVSSGQYCSVQPCHKEIFENKNLLLWPQRCGHVKTLGVVDRSCIIGVVFAVFRKLQKWLTKSQSGGFSHILCCVRNPVDTKDFFPSWDEKSITQKIASATVTVMQWLTSGDSGITTAQGCPS